MGETVGFIPIDEATQGSGKWEARPLGTASYLRQVPRGTRSGLTPCVS